MPTVIRLVKHVVIATVKSVVAISMLVSLSLNIANVNAQSNPLEVMTVTATRQAQPLASQTASISVVAMDELQQISHIHINEALARVPGTWLSRGNGQEHLTAIRSAVLTGPGSCGAFYIAEDGVPVRAAGLCNVNQLFDINTEQAARIEVLRGPGTAVHGSDAQHGVINVISASPSSDPQGYLSLEGGPHDYGRIKFGYSDTLGAHGFVINANGSHDGGYKDDSGYDQQKLSARHDLQRGDRQYRTLLTISNLNQETAGFLVGSDAYKDASRKRQNPNPEAYRDSQSLRWQTRIETQLNTRATLAVTPYARYTDMTFLMHFLPGTPLEENGQRSVGMQTLLSRKISESLTLVNGFDLEYSNGWLKQSQQNGFGVFPSGKQYDYRVDVALAAGFLTANYSLSQQTRLEAGARLEYQQYDYDNRMLDGATAEDGSTCGSGPCRYSRPADSRDDFESLSLNLGVLHQFTDQLQLISRLAYGSRAPQATEMYRLQNGQLQANLDSEQVASVELGFAGNYENWQFRLSSFYMEKDNVIVQNSDRLFLSDGETDHYGVEYLLSWQISPTLSLDFNGSYARHQYANDLNLFGSDAAVVIDGNDLDTAPRHMGTARLGWQPTEHTSVELEWVYMGRYYTDIDNLYDYDGHQLLNIRLQQQLSNAISMGVRVTNLGDQDYAERADFSGFAGERYFVGEPRSIYADIRLKF